MLFGWIIALSSCHVAEFAQQHWSNNTMLMLTITFFIRNGAIFRTFVIQSANLGKL